MLYPAELRDQKKKEIHRLSADMQTNLFVGVAGFEPPVQFPVRQFSKLLV